MMWLLVDEVCDLDQGEEIRTEYEEYTSWHTASQVHLRVQTQQTQQWLSWHQIV